VQVVTNLLVNAARYTPAGGTIELSLSTSAQEAQIAVADNGVGIAPELAAHVFDFFVQAKRSSDRAKGGLGLGLSLVKNLVQAHGGSIALHSDGLGCGATFTVTLPLLQAGVAEAAARAEALAAAAPSPALTIALVDDNADAAKPLAMLLELSGHQPLVFPTAEALLPCIREVAPDACIIDIGLPGMDGYALARQLRSLPALEQPTLVALTGYGTETDQQRAAQAGFDRHFTKPVTFTALLAWLNEAAAARASGLQAGQGQSLPGR
jgi:CheY-like chemotaxis protein